MVKLKAKGTNFERAIKKWYESLGYYVMRSAGSLGLYDLIVITPQGINLVQCKDKYLTEPEEYKIALTFKPIWPEKGKDLYVRHIICYKTEHEFILSCYDNNIQRREVNRYTLKELRGFSNGK